MKLSIVIPTYNRARFLKPMLESIFSENLQEFEILVVDDGSTDETAQVIRNFPVQYIALLHRFGYPSGPRNLGLRAATGNYITFLDSDDLIAPGGLARRWEWLKGSPGALAVGGQVAGYIDEEGIPFSPYPRPREIPALLSRDYLLENLGFPFAVWPYLFSRDLLKEVGGFDENLRIADDCELLFRVLAKTKIPILSTPSIYYRIHSNNLSLTNRAQQLSLNRIAKAEVFLCLKEHGLI